jgi:glycosyltransferase involved in cell wall biosynthesis
MDFTPYEIIFYVFAGATGIILIYLLRWLILLGRNKKHKPDKAIQPVSVVICAYNEEENLRKLVPVLLKQDHPDFEIIIVDDRSFDGTYDYLLELRDKETKVKMVKVDHVPEHVNGKKYGITLGIKAAKNDIVVFTDADCKPRNRKWLQAMTARFDSKTTFVLGYSNYQKKKGLLNTLIRFETLFTGIQYIAEALAGSPYMGVGRNLAYRKSFFLNNKGFNRHLKITGGDDDLFVNEFANKKNTKVASGIKTLVTSLPKVKWSDYFRQKRRHISVGKYYRKRDRFKIGLWGFLYVLHWFTLIFLLVFQFKLYWVLGGYGLKILLLLILLAVGTKKFGDKFPVWLVPILDIYYLVYLLWGVSVSFSRKKVKWK